MRATRTSRARRWNFAVEINNTFYRTPRASLLETWAEQVADGLAFARKARDIRETGSAIHWESVVYEAGVQSKRLIRNGPQESGRSSSHCQGGCRRFDPGFPLQDLHLTRSRDVNVRVAVAG